MFTPPHPPSHLPTHLSTLSTPSTVSAMDYDAYDAILHHIFKQTQGDAWFKPSSESVSTGVCLRVAASSPLSPTPIFRLFPYDTPQLAPFEQACRLLNPVVAVKIRSAAVHASLAGVADQPGEDAIYVDVNTRIQVLDSMEMLPAADKEQCAAFIRDERVLIVWADNLDDIIPLARELDDKLIKLVWRARPGLGGMGTASTAASMTTFGSIGSIGVAPSAYTANPRIVVNGSGANGSEGSLDEKGGGEGSLVGGAVLPAGVTSTSSPTVNSPLSTSTTHAPNTVNTGKPEAQTSAPIPIPTLLPTNLTHTLFGWRTTPQDAHDKHQHDIENADGKEKRPIRLFAPIYGGMGCALSIFFIGSGINVLVQEWVLDGSKWRFFLLITAPFLFCVSLFFSLQIITNLSFVLGPVAQFHENSKYYSAQPPAPNKSVDNRLPHVTVQMPVYKESLEQTIAPSIASLKKAMQTYARQGGTSSIFINEDGMQIIPEQERLARMAFYDDHGIGWVARPKHDGAEGGFKRAGRFKKASNMNYGLRVSMRLERCLRRVMEEREEKGLANGVGASANGAPTTPGVNGGTITEGIPEEEEMDVQERALQMAIEEEYAETGYKFKPWAKNAKAIRMGEIVLIVDSDTIVPEDCFRDAARELAECPEVAIIQHESDVMQVAHHYFENGIAHFTRRINKCISIACANGEVAPFVGHNAFLRWSALQDAAFIDPADGKSKIWSETNVSEDFDMALRLQLSGYIIRWASYSKGGFKEGVSLTCDDELNRWQKYAYGCNELLFNPIIHWWRKGPINKQLHVFIWSDAPIHYKISMLSYMFSYYGLAAAITLSLINYIFLGFAFPVDGFYEHSFEIWLACTVVFPGLGNLGFTLLEYRLGLRSIASALVENMTWVPFFFFFFGGLSIHLSQALLAHLFSYNITWGATKKEVERSNFFLEGPKILKRFWLAFVICLGLSVGMVVLSSGAVPVGWRIDGGDWAVIFPLAVVVGSHVLYPIILNPWLMIFSY